MSNATATFPAPPPHFQLFQPGAPLPPPPPPPLSFEAFKFSHSRFPSTRSLGPGTPQLFSGEGNSADLRRLAGEILSTFSNLLNELISPQPPLSLLASSNSPVNAAQHRLVELSQRLMNFTQILASRRAHQARQTLIERLKAEKLRLLAVAEESFSLVRQGRQAVEERKNCL